MGRQMLRALVVALVVAAGWVMPTAANAAQDCGDGWYKYRDGYMTSEKFWSTNVTTSRNAWIYHSGRLRACTENDTFNDDERRRVLIGQPSESYPFESRVQKNGTYDSFCVTQKIKINMSGIKTSSSFSLGGGVSKNDAGVSWSYTDNTENLTVTLPGARVCGAANRELVAQTSGITATADDEGGKIEWVELYTTISGSYTIKGTKYGVATTLGERDWISKEDEPDPRVPATPHPPPPPPAVCDNDCWRAQLGTQTYNYIENSNMADPRMARIIFDRKFYAAAYPDVRTWAEGKVATQGGTFYDHVQWHWLNYGIPWGRAGSPTFDSAYYLRNQGDVAAAYGSTNYQGAIQHFVSNGRFEGRRGSPFFDPGYYKSRYGDLAGWDNASALDHFTVYGMSEGRQGSADFAPAFYMGTYADLRNAYGGNNYRAGMSHWYSNGSAEGRTPRP
ncbi:hypothetical protein KMZ32_16360 [Phycicoccus sp. MAQZ13P-2]|uniref:hypothetical protein n=1 Tax=Phycicoccus mangrovi TaxID=2840470 RepID=UPI001BFFFE65|nr:hypothetical protein [Phycicoccus mangrovi]MBT9257473.1 hypothetical protein [Phycicoccus mangrovi]MBT9275653.1 hypothetical protein [Phycicoccus mangrovi]